MIDWYCLVNYIVPPVDIPQSEIAHLTCVSKYSALLEFKGCGNVGMCGPANNAQSP